MVGTVETPVLVEPQVEGVHRRHRRIDIVLERFLDTAGERRQHEHRLEVLLVQDLHPGVAVLVLGMIGQRSTFISDAGSTPSGISPRNNRSRQPGSMIGSNVGFGMK